MAEHTIQKWVETVVKQMKFPPDRKYVRQELWDHLLDSRDCRMEQGMELKSAEEAAVKAMGDPVETGKLLNKIHGPWKGWLWMVSRVLLLTVFLFCFKTACENNYFSLTNLIPDWRDCGCGQVCSYQPGQNAVPPLEFETTQIMPGAVEQVGVYTLTLDHGSWYTAENQQFVVLGFRFKAESLIDMDPIGFDRFLRAEDDQGNQFEDWQVGSSSYRGPTGKVRAPYVHLVLSIPDGVLRKWVRFYVPDTEFDMTISAEGRVLPWPKQED